LTRASSKTKNNNKKNTPPKGSWVARANAPHSAPPRLAPARHSCKVWVFPVHVGFALVSSPEARYGVVVSTAYLVPVSHAQIISELVVYTERKPALSHGLERDVHPVS
jgi:hypothetical protein